MNENNYMGGHIGLLQAQHIAETENNGMTLAEIEEELKELEDRKKYLQELYASKCDDAIKEAIEKSSQEQKLTRISEHPRIVIVHVSDLVGKPWNTEFHDWYGSKDTLLKYLMTKPAAKWHDTILELAKSAKNGVINIHLFDGKYQRNTPISLEFVQAVLAKLD